MRRRWALVVVPAAFTVVACGASFPPPTQRMADAQSSQRAAQELGAANEASAKLHVRLADEQMAGAKKLMSAGDNKAADALLVRSKADSELALALTREQKAAADLQAALAQTNETATTNSSQGAEK
jgi:hypothetical protein